MKIDIDIDLLVISGISIFVSFLFLTFTFVGNILDYYLWFFGGLCIGICPILLYVFDNYKKEEVD